MTDKRVKVIKQTDRDRARSIGKDERRVGGRTASQTKLDPVAVVSEWVRELRRRKAEEGRQGFDGLFSKAA